MPRYSAHSLAIETFVGSPPVKSAKTKPRRDELKAGQCLCDFCTGKCCRYFSLPIDTPHSWDDFDSIRWYLAHGQTLVYVVKEQWYLLVRPAAFTLPMTIGAGST